MPAQLIDQPAKTSDIDVEQALRSILTYEREDVFQFAAETYQKCVLNYIYPPQAPFLHRFATPGGGYGPGQFIWDTPFTVDLLALLPENRDVIREIFQNYWDFQERWDAATPEYAHGMITSAIIVGDDVNSITASYSQLPTLAWGIERVYRRNRDLELVKTALEPLERFHEWFWRERDVTNLGLVGVGCYSGAYRQAIYEPADWEPYMDDMEITPHPTRKYSADDTWYGVSSALGMLAGTIHPMRMFKQRNWYGNVMSPTSTASLILAEDSLARLAELAGDSAMAARRRARQHKASEAMRTHMWDEKAGTFLAVWRDSLEKIRVPTIGSWLPLRAGIPTQAMADRMAEVLATPEWNTPLPVCTVERNSPYWIRSSVWHGGVWPATNYAVAEGLVRYGHHELAAEFCDKIIDNAMKRGLNEHYHSDTGEPLGVPDLNMSCILITMMLDGLTRKFVLKTKN